MPPRPSRAQRQEITRLSINIGKLPTELTRYIIDIIKARNDILTILSLISTCRNLYNLLAPVIYEEVSINKDNYKQLFYGLGPDFQGPPIPKIAPAPHEGTNPFSRKYNLIQSIRFLFIDEIECLPEIIKLKRSLWREGDINNPTMDLFDGIFTLSFGFKAIFELNKNPARWESHLNWFCMMLPGCGLCYETGPLGLSFRTTKIIQDALCNNLYDILTMHVYDLKDMDIDDKKRKIS